MDIKKYLQDKAEKDFSDFLTEDDKLYIQQLTENYKESEEYKMRKKPKAKSRKEN